jgi:hypothetical protein
MLQSYIELIKRVPLLKTLGDSGDVDALETLYKNVSIL